MTNPTYTDREKANRFTEWGAKTMLIIDGNSVYEIDEECIKKRKVSKDCGVYEKIMQTREKSEIQEGKKQKGKS